MFILLFNYIYYERKHDFKLNVSTYVCSWTFCNYSDKHAWWSIVNNCLDGPSSDIWDIDLLIVCFWGNCQYPLKTNIDTSDTLIYPHGFIFIIISQFLKKKKYRLQRPVLNWFTESNKKLNRWCCMGVDKIGKKNTVFASSEHKDSSCIPLFNILISRIFWEIYR